MNFRALAGLPVSGILILVAAAALSLGGGGLVLYSARMTREAVSRRVDLIRRDRDVLTSVVPTAASLIRSGLKGAEERERRTTARIMSKLGVPERRAGVVLTLIRMLMMAVFALLGFMAISHWSSSFPTQVIPILLAAACGIVGWFVPIKIVRKAVSARTKSVVAGLPDALELLVICVEAGLSFEDGIDRIASALHKSQPALAEELALTAADLKVLPSREQALANLAGRVDMPSVRSVVSTLSQTLRYGTPLAQALRVVSGELRNETLMRLEERANQLPALMTIPMMLFILPTIFMIVAGPAVLRMIDVFKH